MLVIPAIDIRGGTVNYNAMLALPSQVLRIANHTANLNADQGQTLAGGDLDDGDGVLFDDGIERIQDFCGYKPHRRAGNDGVGFLVALEDGPGGGVGLGAHASFSFKTVSR